MSNGSLKLNIFIKYYNTVLWIIEIKILIEYTHLSVLPLFILSHHIFFNQVFKAKYILNFFPLEKEMFCYNS